MSPSPLRWRLSLQLFSFAALGVVCLNKVRRWLQPI
jgi:hypothetical protein